MSLSQTRSKSLRRLMRGRRRKNRHHADVPVREYAISDAFTKAEQILKRIDERWPSKTN